MKKAGLVLTKIKHQ